MSINELQREAARAEPDVAQKIVAGAGTGKTTTMVNRFAHLVSAHGLDPARILAVTFTNRAAAELRDRITATLLGQGLVADRASLDSAWIGTFHGLCVRLLREDCYEIGFDRDTRVIDQLEERLLVRDVQSALRDDRVAGAGILEMEAIGVEGAVKLSTETFGFIQRIKGLGLTPDGLEGRCSARARAYWHDLAERDGSDENPEERIAEEEAARLICATYQEYEKRLSERRLLDFDGILLRTREGLREHPGWAQRCRERFQYIIVDEFQDTSRVQLDVLALLAAAGFANVSVVGDPKQSIYSWRDAQMRNLLDFAGTERRLLTNYRSPQPILDLATQVIRGDPLFAGEPSLVAAGVTTGETPTPGSFASPASGGAAVSLYRAGTPEEEAGFVASTIVRLREQGREWPDIAILTRMRNPPIAFEQELRRAAIPYVTAGGYGFFDREEVKDVLAHLAVIDNPLRDEALTRLLQGPLVRVSDAELYSLMRQRLGTARSNQHLWDALTASEAEGMPELLEPARTRVTDALALVRRLAGERAGMAVSELVQEVIDQSGYARHAAADVAEADRRLGNLRKLYRLAGDFEASTAFSGIGDFLAYVDLHEANAIEVAEADVGGSNAVRFMTVHAAKGLEFPVVFLAHLKPLRQAHRGWMFFDDEMGLILKTLGERDGAETGKHAAWKRLRGDAGTLPMNVEQGEMRRLVYVATTRAQEQLFVSATRRDEPDWAAVLSTLDARGRERVHPEDDHFRTMALHLRDGGSGVLLEPASEPPRQRVLDFSASRSAPAESRALALPGSAAPPAAALAAGRLEISFTQLEVLAQCPLRYRHLFEWRIPAPPDDLWPDSARHQNSLAASTLGTLVHAVLERFHQPGRQPERDTAPDLDTLHTFWQAASLGVVTAAEAGALWSSDARAMFENYLASDVAHLETIANEQEVNLVMRVADTDVLIRGFIDRLCRAADGSILVLDYKTNRGMSAATHESHDRQLAIYSRAVTEALGLPGRVDAAVIELRTGMLHRAGAGGWDGVERLLQQLVAGHREAPANPPCSGCAYSPSCPSSTRRRTGPGAGRPPQQRALSPPATAAPRPTVRHPGSPARSHTPSPPAGPGRAPPAWTWCGSRASWRSAG